MNQYFSRPDMNAPKLSATLLMFSTIEFILGTVFAVIEFLLSFILGAILADSVESIGLFFLFFFIGLIGAGIIFYVSFLISILLKARASTVLNTYVNAINSEKIAYNTMHTRT